MTQKYIEIKIDAFGGVLTEANGFNGIGCTEATSFLNTLGGVQDTDYRPEFYAAEAVVECARV